MTLKRTLALLLSIALLFSFAMPALAETTPEPNPAMPVITSQSPERVYLQPHQFRTTFYVEASIPNGDPIAFQWYIVEFVNPLTMRTSRLVGETGPSLRVQRSIIGIPPSYFVVIYNTNLGPQDETNVTAGFRVAVAQDDQLNTFWRVVSQAGYLLFIPFLPFIVLWNFVIAPIGDFFCRLFN